VSALVPDVFCVHAPRNPDVVGALDNRPAIGEHGDIERRLYFSLELPMQQLRFQDRIIMMLLLSFIMQETLMTQ
jgi:hypothetical protein